ncbi:hypothetical protein C8R44DRAFT_885519 [Mycena epipterygia]|nr:hypothetical protein C8R44DRAFT_885519 [Mycena epipterygia]
MACFDTSNLSFDNYHILSLYTLRLHEQSKVVHIHTETASGSRTARLKQHTIASDVPLDKLKVSPEQLQQLQELYRASPDDMDDGTAPVDYLYKVSDDDQLAASAMMAQQGLDIDAREQMDNCWSTSCKIWRRDLEI